jgi:hypothetical protein
MSLHRYLMQISLRLDFYCGPITAKHRPTIWQRRLKPDKKDNEQNDVVTLTWVFRNESSRKKSEWIVEYDNNENEKEKKKQRQKTCFCFTCVINTFFILWFSWISLWISISCPSFLFIQFDTTFSTICIFFSWWVFLHSILLVVHNLVRLFSFIYHACVDWFSYMLSICLSLTIAIVTLFNLVVSVCMKKNSKSDFVTGFFQIECMLWHALWVW